MDVKSLSQYVDFLELTVYDLRNRLRSLYAQRAQVLSEVRNLDCSVDGVNLSGQLYEKLVDTFSEVNESINSLERASFLVDGLDRIVERISVGSVDCVCCSERSGSEK